MKAAIPMLVFLLLLPAQVLAQENVCEPFDFRCMGKTVQQCNTIGNQWVDIGKCNTSCHNGQCDPELRTNWGFLITGIIALVIIAAIVQILWKKKRPPKPPQAPPKTFISMP